MALKKDSCNCELIIAKIDLCPGEKISPSNIHERMVIIGSFGGFSVMKAAEEILESKRNIGNLSVDLAFDKLKEVMKEVSIRRQFSEKPQKRNFVNKFNKNQHRKK